MHATTTLRQLIKLAGPVLVSQLAVMANGVIDTMMAGHLSSTEQPSHNTPPTTNSTSQGNRTATH